MNTIKLEKFENNIMRIVSDTLRIEANDKHLHEVTITEVKVNNDFSRAKIYFSILNETDLEQVTQSLHKAHGYLRTALASKLEAKHVPELIFVHDESIEQASRIEAIIDSLNE